MPWNFRSKFGLDIEKQKEQIKLQSKKEKKIKIKAIINWILSFFPPNVSHIYSFIFVGQFIIP